MCTFHFPNGIVEETSLSRLIIPQVASKLEKKKLNDFCLNDMMLYIKNLKDPPKNC